MRSVTNQMPSLWATTSILLVVTLVAGDRHFGRRSGLPDFATNDLLRHARASSTLLEEHNEQEAESRQLPVRREFRAKQRQLRPVLNSQGPSNVRPIRSRNRGSNFGSAEVDGASNFIQGEWPRKSQNEQRDGARYDKNGNRIRHATANEHKLPRQKVKHLLIPKQVLKQNRPLSRPAPKHIPQLPQPLARRGQSQPDSREIQKRLEILTTPDAGQISAPSRQSFAPQRLPPNGKYEEEDQRPAYNYKRPSTSPDRPNYSIQPSPVRRRVDSDLEAVIEDVIADPVYRETIDNRQHTSADYNGGQRYQPPPEEYQVVSAPAVGSPSNRRESYVESPYGYQIPAEQRDLQAAVISRADAYGAYASQHEHGVYQNEDRLNFQIHGHDGPHSYRYGYDTGNGYNRQFRYEERNGEGYLKGRYGFFDKYGDLKVTNYSADPYAGFHAEGADVPKYPH